jgi:hypothetical protein
MLRIYLINFVLVLVLAGNASAADTWVGGSGLWSTPAKWTDGSVPTAADAAVIDIAGSNCQIDSSVTAECITLDVSLNNKTCYLNMSGGTLTTSNILTIGHTGSPTLGDACGVFTMTGGTIKTGGASMFVGYGTGSAPSPADDSFGTFKMTTGCDVNVGKKIECGKNGTGVGQIYVDGGTLFVGYPINEDLELGKYGTGTLYMTGGDVNCDDRIKLSEGGGTSTIYITDGNLYCNSIWFYAGNPTVYLDGGLLICSTIDMSAENAKIDITEGELRVGTDTELAKIQGYVSAKKIIGYHGDGYAIAELYGGEIHVTARMSDPNLAWKPSPGNYATVEWTPAGPALSWKPGQYAAKHDVYFGTDKNDVNDATDPNTLPGRGRQNPCTFAFPSPPPVLGQTYYWRIDEVNDACAPYIWKGLVWQFTMADYEEVEDFDSYANDIALKAVWTLTGGTGSAISRDTTTIRSGNSMKYVYKNNGATEAAANTTGANKLPVDINDWTTADIKALTLYFYGVASNNSAEKMYVALKSTNNNSAVVYYDNPGDLNKPEWHEWNIKLSDFTGVNLHSISNVYIGFGNRGSPPASNGTVYFDDIRLYPRRCVASRLPAGFGDVDGDCNVGFVDVNIMAGDWLETDANRKGSDGVLKGGASWVTDGTRHCIQLNSTAGTNDWVDLDDSDFSNFHNKTIAFWVKIRAFPTSSSPYIFFFTNGAATNPYRIYIQTHGDGAVRARFLEDYSKIDFITGTDVWRHMAFVLEDTDDGGCTGTFYGDGILVDDWTPGQPRHSGGAIGVNLGSSKDGSSDFVNAVFDDFRVYNRALTGNEVQNLYYGVAPDANMLLHYDFNEVSGLTAHNSSTYVYYHPLLSPAELYKGEAEGSRVINFRDFAILANSWLEEQLWP